jgi:hypothetical protein
METESEVSLQLRRYAFLKDELDRTQKAHDGLSENQGKVRRNLLISGFLALIVGRTNLVPSKIDALGVSFDTAQQQNFRFIIGAVVIYFLFVFIYQMLRITFYDSRRNASFRELREVSQTLMEAGADMRTHEMLRGSYRYARAANLLGPFVEVYLPVFVALLGFGAIFNIFPKGFFFGAI